MLEGALSEENRLAAIGKGGRIGTICNARIFRYFKTSPEIIRLAVMMYSDIHYRFGMSRICRTSAASTSRTSRCAGTLFAAEIRRGRVQAMRAFRHRRWQLDEVFVKINGEKHYLWRAVDHEGEVLESFVTKRRAEKAALKFLKKSLKRHGATEVIMTDRLASYGAALKA